MSANLLPSRLHFLDRVWKPLPGGSGAAYDHDYFHGVTSGYPPEGYASAHPDWGAWLDVIGRLQPHGTLVDLGCAYGYLLREAGPRGYRGFGVDTSAWALAQEPSLSRRLARADAHHLPLRSAVADIVTLFDILEHLERPWMCLAEAARILAPHGLLVGATPDPLFFQRPEPTHCFERPPSFWLKLLQELGFQVQFRFSGPAYNFQFLACSPGSPLARRLALFQHDYIAEVPDFIQSAPLPAVPRTGWGPLQEGFRAVSPEGASLYLYNPGHSVALSFSAEAVTTGRLGTLEIRLDDLPLARIHCTTEAHHYSISVDDLPLPEGGHHLHFRVQPPHIPFRLGRLRLQAECLHPAALTSGLPFDLYQRYRRGAELAASVAPGSILDVGGLLGDRQGHMAVPRDFLDPASPGAQVVSCDLRQADHWDHVPADALDLPFHDDSFDLVLSLDVLEHVLPQQRHRFLAELARVAAKALVIGCPEGTPAVSAAEARLSEGLMQEHAFLQEHAALGLPEPGMVRRFFEARGYTVFRFPSGHLPAWLGAQVLTQLFFRVPDWRLFRSWNEAYNRSFFDADLKDPAYRSIYLILAPGFPEAESLPATFPATAGAETAATDSAAAAAHQPDLIPPAVVTAFHRWVTGCEQALLDAQFLANTRIELAELQSRQLDELMSRIQTLETRREGLALELRPLRGTPLWRLAWQRLRRRLRRSP